MLIDLDFFDVFYCLSVAIGLGLGVYFAWRYSQKKVIEELRVQSALILTRVNDVDCAVADLKREVGEIECHCAEKKDS